MTAFDNKFEKELSIEKDYFQKIHGERLVDMDNKFKNVNVVAD